MSKKLWIFGIILTLLPLHIATAADVFAYKVEPGNRPSLRSIREEAPNKAQWRKEGLSKLPQEEIKTYENFVLGFKIDYPERLGEIKHKQPGSATDREDSDEAIIYFSPTNKQIHGVVRIGTKHYDHEVTMDDLRAHFEGIDARKADPDSEYQRDNWRTWRNLEILETEETTHKGAPAFVSLFSFWQSTKPDKAKQVRVASGKDMYIITFIDEEEYFDKEVSYFDDMVATFTPLKAISKAKQYLANKQKREAEMGEENEELFHDMPTSHPYNAAVRWAKKRGVLKGYPDGSFKADREVNRAEFLKIVLEALQVDINSVAEASGHSDVDENAWYAPYVRYAKRHGIVQGYPDGTFKPGQSVNLAEALKIAYKTLEVDAPEAADGPWYQRYLSHAQGNAVLFDNAMKIDRPVLRKDVTWIIWKLSEQSKLLDAE